MNAREAIGAAADWVRSIAARIDGYAGAYLSGSALERAPEAEWPLDSDVDVVLVYDGLVPAKIGKLRWKGALLEPTWMPKQAFADFDGVMRTHYLAWGLHGGCVLDDPQGWLRPLAEHVAAEYLREDWLRARVDAVAALARRHIDGISSAQSPEDRLMSCAFGPSCAAFPILAAAGRNCTVRKRIPAARAVLATQGRMDFARRLEQGLGCENMGRDELWRHMDALERAFDAAARTDGPSRTYPFRSDIRPEARSVAIDGSRRMIEGDHPADAVFWMMATFARSLTVLRMDDAALYAAHLPALQAFAAALGVDGPERALERQRLARQILMESEQVAAEILSKTARRESGLQRASDVL